MADRYWVGGTGTWSSTNTLNWSSTVPLSFTASRAGSTLTTVGSPAIVVPMELFDATGASKGVIISGSVNTWTTSSSGTITSQTCVASTATSVPTAADDVFFNATSNGGVTAFTVTMANTPRLCNDFTASGLDGTMTLAGTSIGLTVSGSLTFQATNFTRTYTGTTTFNATTTGKTVTTNGVAFGAAVTFNGVGGAWALGSALQLTGGSLTLTNGTLDLDGKTLTTGFRFATDTGTKNLTFNGGTLVCQLAGANSFTNPAPTGFTTTAGTGTGTISLTSGSAKTFNGAGSTFNCTLNQAGAGALTITGSNTFSNITNTRKSTSAASILFTAGTTNTFADWNASGESTRLLTIGSVTAASHTLSKASGTVSSDFLSISRSTATGGAGWYAGANSTDGGNNSGWIFTAPPGGGYTITANNGFYTITGQSATLSKGRFLLGDSGTYGVTGQNAVITYSSITINTDQLLVKLRSFTEKRRF